MTPYTYEVGDIVRMKKKHPCGSFEWEILRVDVYKRHGPAVPESSQDGGYAIIKSYGYKACACDLKIGGSLLQDVLRRAKEGEDWPGKSETDHCQEDGRCV